MVTFGLEPGSLPRSVQSDTDRPSSDFARLSFGSSFCGPRVGFYQLDTGSTETDRYEEAAKSMAIFLALVAVGGVVIPLWRWASGETTPIKYTSNQFARAVAGTAVRKAYR